MLKSYIEIYESLTDCFIYLTYLCREKKIEEMDYEIKRAQEVKAVREDSNLFIEGYASVFGVVDSYDDVVVKGAFTNTLINDAKRVKFCWQHNLDDVIGKIIEMREDDRGLWFKAKISNTSKGKDVAILVEDDALDEVSFAYRTKKYLMDEETDIRKLLEVELIEISLVTRAANPQAIITGTEKKSEEEKLAEAVEIIFSKVENLSDDDLVRLKVKIDNDYTKRILKLI